MLLRLLTDMLQSYKSALVRRETATIELSEQIENQKTAEMTAKYKECNEAERQLTQIETRLGESSSCVSCVYGTGRHTCGVEFSRVAWGNVVEACQG